jgi:mycoredoxin
MATSKDMIIMYGTTWCPDCTRSKRVLATHDVEYKWIDIDEEIWAADEVIKLNNGNKSVPTILFPDGTVLVEPSDQELETKLGV